MRKTALVFSILYVAVGILGKEVKAEETFFIHSDHLGSTTLITKDGEVVEKNLHYPFGSVRTPSTDHSPLTTEKGYTSQTSDVADTNLLYYNARYYNPITAKFTQADPQGGTLNRYAYVSNNPVNKIDPTGNMDEIFTGGVIDEENMIIPLDKQQIMDVNELVWGEASGANPYDIQEMLAWIFVYKSIRGYDPDSNADQNVDIGCLIPNKNNPTLSNSEGCKVQQPEFKKTRRIVKDVITDYFTGKLPEGLYQNEQVFMGYANDLYLTSPGGGSIKFKSIAEKAGWLYMNLSHYQKTHPNFWFKIKVTQTYIWQKGKIVPNWGAPNNGLNILVIGNENFISDGQYGGQDREGAGTTENIDPLLIEMFSRPSYRKNYLTCFPDGTKIKMADGSEKEIEKIQSGDRVISFDLEKEIYSESEVEYLETHPDNPGGYLIINNKFKVTGNHLVWSPDLGSWVKAEDLMVGNYLLNNANQMEKIESIRKVEGNYKVFNLHLKREPHNFFADGILVHNVKPMENEYPM